MIIESFDASRREGFARDGGRGQATPPDTGGMVSGPIFAHERHGFAVHFRSPRGRLRDYLDACESSFAEMLVRAEAPAGG